MRNAVLPLLCMSCVMAVVSVILEVSAVPKAVVDAVRYIVMLVPPVLLVALFVVSVLLPCCLALGGRTVRGDVDADVFSSSQPRYSFWDGATPCHHTPSKSVV
eukprot:m51a1_g2066 hypothetical protein (103) ;mRNA; f:1443316-1443873